MSSADDDESNYATLGLPPDATFAQVKARFKELNDAYLAILEQSRKEGAASKHPQAGATKSEQPHGPSAQETHTEPVATLKDKLASGKIDKAQFERLVRERYAYLHNKPFADLTDDEFQERLNGFEGLKFKL